MSDRGVPIPDGAPACPFVAFDDDRDARSTAPDHKHRCFAEQTPSPRALAHQDAYCLSSAFPVCPTFQDWARREAAPARRDAVSPVAPPRPAPARPPMAAPPTSSPQPSPAPAPLVPFEPADAAGDAPIPDGPGLAAWSGRTPDAAPPIEARGYPPVPPAAPGRRSVPRDWAAPPPWTSDDEPLPPVPAASTAIPGWSQDVAAQSARPKGRDAVGDRSRGLAGSDLERLAGPDPAGPPARPAGAYLPAGARQSRAPQSLPPQSLVGQPLRPEPPKREAFDPAASHRDPAWQGHEPQESRDAHEARTAAELFGPAWEQPRRFEAYPSLRTRVGIPSFAGVPPVAVGAIALVIAAGLLFFIGPMLLGIGGKGPAASSPSPVPTVAATPTPLPTDPPGPTATVYTVVKGDTMVKIASKFGITVDQLMTANPQVKNPNKIKIGDQLTIPAPIATEVSGVGGASPSPSAAP